MYGHGFLTSLYGPFWWFPFGVVITTSPTTQEATPWNDCHIDTRCRIGSSLGRSFDLLTRTVIILTIDIGSEQTCSEPFFFVQKCCHRDRRFDILIYMLDVTIVSVGSIKERYWQEAIGEYLKRLQPHAKVQTIEVPEEKITHVTDRDRIIAKEAERILAAIPKDTSVIALDRAGKTYSSREWADQLDDWSRFAKKLTFVIGGPLGLAPVVLERATVIMSLSKMTFTHQMTRVILLEQLYRAGMILSGGQYHY